MNSMTSNFGTITPSHRVLPAGVVIVAAPTFAADLAAVRATALTDVVVLELAATEPLALSTLASAPVAVVEVDPGSEASLARIMGLRQRFPKLPVIAALARADINTTRTLIRNGIKDVAELPFKAAELAVQIIDVAAEQAGHSAEPKLCPLYTIVGSTGGMGATSVLTHLAAEIAKDSPGKAGVCVIDLDLQKGTVAPYLGVEPEVTIRTLIESGGRLDRDLMMSAVIDTQRGYSFIAAPETIAPIEGIDVDQLLAIVQLARAVFDYVLIDLPPIWTDWTLSMAKWSDRVVLLTDSSFSGVRQAKRTINLLGSIDMAPDCVVPVVNRMERKLFGATRSADVARALGRDELGSIADAGPALRSAQDQGILLQSVHAKSKFAADITKLAADLTAQGGAA